MPTIIKASDETRAGGAAAFRLDELTGAAGQIAGVRGQAADILAKAHQEADEIRRRAEEEGRVAALLAAEQILDERVGQRLNTLLPALSAALEGLAAAKTEWLAHWERTAVHVAAEIAGCVIRRQVERTPEITLTLIAEALELAAGSGQLQLRLHPDDFDALGQHAQRVAEELARLGKVDVVADPAITKGGCRVDSRFGTIDQQFEAQLARIEQELTERLLMQLTLDDVRSQLQSVLPTALCGSLVRTAGMTAAVADFPAPVGALVEIERGSGPPIAAEVIGFRDELTMIYLLDDVTGVRHGNRVRLVKTSRWIRVGEELLGRVIDAHGRAIDGKPQPALAQRVPLERPAMKAIERPRIDTPLSTGIRAVDGLLTCGKGQRIGIFAGSGVGKSVTLGMMSRYTAADVNVVALIGERGREVNDFIHRDLGPGLAKSVVVVATSDEPALARVQAAHTATAVAEYFREQGKDVLLVMDSLTRWAMAQREIGLAAGEPPTTRGFPPSVFAMLPKLLERAGRSPQGSITGFYSVLVEGDDPQEPICDAVRGLLDGHAWLSRKLAARGHYPAIDVLQSISRLMTEVADLEHRQAAQTVRELLAALGEHEDLISIGAYRRGANPTVDVALDMHEAINDFLRQRVDEPSSVQRASEALAELAQHARALKTAAASA